MSIVATLLQISDLHFAPELTEEGRKLWGNMFVNSHSFGKLDALSAKIASLEGRGLKADVLLATGDLSTDGSEKSLKTALEFINEENIYRGNPGRLVTVGLGVKSHQRIVIPGNHDRYNNSWLPYQQASDYLEKVFGLPDKYPYVLGYQEKNKSDENKPTLIFFVFDSTATESVKKSFAPWVRIARGRIEDAECRILASQPALIKSNGIIQGIDGKTLNIDYDKAIKIAVIHHHPIEKKRMSETDRESGLFDSWKFMENNQSFVDACFEARVDLVLFGHQHKVYSESRVKEIQIGNFKGRHRVNFICCPSATEFSEKENGFYFLDIYEDKCVVHPFIWNGTSFVDDEQKTFEFMRELQLGAGK